MKISTKFLSVPALGLFIFSLVGFTYLGGGEWKVPDDKQKTKNPVAANKTSLDAGKELYDQYCKSCHGKFGEGDGPKASELKTELIDFTQSKFQSQTDGALFYKITTGRDEMPSSRKKITDDEDVWNIINYMRTFAKKK